MEKYFGIVIDNIEQEAEPSALKANPSKESQDVDKVKYLSGHTARKYLKCSKAEFESLIEQGIIKAHRDEYNRWKVSKESVIDYSKSSLPSNDTQLIINEVFPISYKIFGFDSRNIIRFLDSISFWTIFVPQNSWTAMIFNYWVHLKKSIFMLLPLQGEI